jgi:acyl carrier protein
MTTSGPSTYETIKRLMAETCLVDPAMVEPEARLAGFGIDSIGVLELVLAIEDTFPVQVENEDMLAVKTVKDLVEYVDRLRAR